MPIKKFSFPGSTYLGWQLKGYESRSRTMKIRFTSRKLNEDAADREVVRSVRIDWKIYLLLIPAVIAVAFLSTLIFSIIFPLFLLGGILVYFWALWIFNKLRKTAQVDIIVGESLEIKETGSVESNADKRQS